MNYPRFIEHNGVLLDQSGLKTILPHRGPALLIDGVIAFSQKNKSLTALRQLYIQNPEFAGHFPDNPILALNKTEEMALLACGILAWCLFPDIQGIPIAIKVGEKRCLKMIKPTITLSLNVKLIRIVKGVFIFSGNACNEQGDVMVTFEKLYGMSG